MCNWGLMSCRRGCQVMACPFVVHRHPEFFPDPLRFDPDRWTPEKRKALPDMAYFPFGGGVRRCIGEPFAWVEGPLVAATLAQRWQLECLPGQVVAPARAFICRPRNGIRMRLIRRRANVAVPAATTLVTHARGCVG